MLVLLLASSTSCLAGFRGAASVMIGIAPPEPGLEVAAYAGLGSFNSSFNEVVAMHLNPAFAAVTGGLEYERRIAQLNEKNAVGFRNSLRDVVPGEP